MGQIDPQALAGLYDAHWRALVLYARNWLDEGLAQDAAQEAFLRLAQQGSVPRSPKAWLFTCLRNAAISRARSAARRAGREQAVALGRGQWFEPDLAAHVDAQAAQEALEALPPEQREAVVLRIWGGLTLREIGEITGWPISTVAHTISTALAAIRQRMVQPCRNHAKD